MNNINMAEPLFELESNFRNELNGTNWVSNRLRDAFRIYGITLGNASRIFPDFIQYQGRASEYYIIIDHSYRGPVKTPRYAVRQEKDKYAVYKAYFINHKGRTPLLTLSKAEFEKILNQDDCQLVHLINCRILGEENHSSIDEPLFDIMPDLSGITFPINIEKILLFSGCSFTKKVDLRMCNFREAVHFYNVTFKENASFHGATFESEAHFRGTTFNRLANFIEVTFGEYVEFYGTTFEGDAYFNRASFNCVEVEFTGIKCETPIYFNHVRYWPNTIFHRWFRKLPESITSKVKYPPENPNDPDEKVKYKYPSGRPCKEAEFLMDSQNIDEVNSPRFKRYVADQQFIRAFRKEHKFLAAVWRWSSDYGRSFGVWAFWSFIIAVVFAFIYWLFGNESIAFNVDKLNDVSTDFWDYLYYSVVTFTTLGFGDIVPLTNWARLAVGIEVVLGYVMLGGLISIFANKLARRS